MEGDEKLAKMKETLKKMYGEIESKKQKRKIKVLKVPTTLDPRTMKFNITSSSNKRGGKVITQRVTIDGQEIARKTFVGNGPVNCRERIMETLKKQKRGNGAAKPIMNIKSCL